MTDPLDFVRWEESPPGDNPVDEAPPVDRPTEWNGKPIPENALWEEDGITPQLTPSGRIKRTRAARSHKSTTTAKASDLATVRADLVELFAFGAISSAPLLPTVSLVLTERGEMTADAIVALCKDRPAMLAAIQRVSKVGPVVVVVQTGFQVVAAATLDLGRAPINNPLAMMTGVTEKYMQTHPNATVPVPPGVMPPFTGGGSNGVPPFESRPQPETMADPGHARYAFAGHAGPGDNGVGMDAPASFTPHAGGALGNPFPE